jgi:hypothetical protein
VTANEYSCLEQINAEGVARSFIKRNEFFCYTRVYTNIKPKEGFLRMEKNDSINHSSAVVLLEKGLTCSEEWIAPFKDFRFKVRGLIINKTYISVHRGSLKPDKFASNCAIKCCSEMLAGSESPCLNDGNSLFQKRLSFPEGFGA